MGQGRPITSRRRAHDRLVELATSEHPLKILFSNHRILSIGESNTLPKA